MSPPAFSDLGKKAKDVFGKGYHFGLLKLDCKTKTATGVEFNTGGHSDQEKGKVFGSLETKYKVKDYGLTFTEKWNTDNTLSTEVAMCDYFPGVKASANVNFKPHTGDKTGLIKAGYCSDVVHVNADVDLKQIDKPVLLASAVVGHQGWLAGYQGGFDVDKKKLTSNNFALGFTTTDFGLHTSVAEGQIFRGSIYQRINPKMEAAVNIAWQSDNSDTQFGLGTTYVLDQDASIRAKIDNKSMLGLGYQQRLREGIVITLSALIDGSNINSGGHKVGFALELEA